MLLLNTWQKCSESQVLCGTRDLCVPLNWWCDGAPDCPDGSDETNCTTTTTTTTTFQPPTTTVRVHLTWIYNIHFFPASVWIGTATVRCMYPQSPNQPWHVAPSQPWIWRVKQDKTQLPDLFQLLELADKSAHTQILSDSIQLDEVWPASSFMSMVAMVSHV